jgi:hypothetical protein
MDEEAHEERKSIEETSGEDTAADSGTEDNEAAADGTGP